MTIRFEDRDAKKPTKLDLAVSPIEDVHFSPDGLWLVFESTDENGNRDIYFSTLSGGNLTRLTSDPKDEFDPVWRPHQ
jgi:Tol biopolymer transport system component